MSKAEERACQYTGYCRNQSYSDFLNGYHQAEKDLELCANAYQLGVKESDWESLRHQYAGMAMQGILANVDFVHTSIKAGEDLGICCQTVAARNAVAYADALIKELKGEE